MEIWLSGEVCTWQAGDLAIQNVNSNLKSWIEYLVVKNNIIYNMNINKKDYKNKYQL